MILIYSLVVCVLFVWMPSNKYNKSSNLHNVSIFIFETAGTITETFSCGASMGRGNEKSV